MENNNNHVYTCNEWLHEKGTIQTIHSPLLKHIIFSTVCATSREFITLNHL